MPEPPHCPSSNYNFIIWRHVYACYCYWNGLFACSNKLHRHVRDSHPHSLHLAVTVTVELLGAPPTAPHSVKLNHSSCFRLVYSCRLSIFVSQLFAIFFFFAAVTFLALYPRINVVFGYLRKVLVEVHLISGHCIQLFFALIRFYSPYFTFTSFCISLNILDLALFHSRNKQILVEQIDGRATQTV